MNGHAPLNGASGGGGTKRSRTNSLLLLFYPGLGVKRWLLIGAAGIGAMSVGTAYLLRKLFLLGFPEFLPGYMEGVFLMAMGMLAIGLGIYGLYRSLRPLLFASATFDTLANTIYVRRYRGKGPRIVAIGGGTGLSVLLRGLKHYTDNLTAIVTVGDDGGSSGRLRQELGVLPPGDFRNCLVAMSDAEPLVTELFQYRFDQGNGLKGHSFGNLFLVAMANITRSFERALYESSRVLAVHGQILPATTANLSLYARLSNGSVVHGESNITAQGGQVEQLFVNPPDAQAYLPAVEAIEQAQLIIIGPGSLYTSILPNLLVSGISEAIKRSRATKVYVCNVATQKGETEGYSVADHVEALQRHTFTTIVDYVIANDTPRDLGPQFQGRPVAYDGRPLHHAKLLLEDVMDLTHPVRHDSARLARAIMNVYHKKRNGKSKATPKVVAQRAGAGWSV